MILYIHAPDETAVNKIKKVLELEKKVRAGVNKK
jgi:hypothetical protein